MPICGVFLIHYLCDDLDLFLRSESSSSCSRRAAIRWFSPSPPTTSATMYGTIHVERRKWEDVISRSFEKSRTDIFVAFSSPRFQKMSKQAKCHRNPFCDLILWQFVVIWFSVVEQLGGKQLVMTYLSHEDPNVRYEALLAVQKLMVHNW